LLLTVKAWFDPFREELEEGVNIPVSWAINGRRPEDKKTKFMSMGEDEVFSHPFALAIGRDRFALISLFLLPPILAGTCCSLA
jgi:hypothetical protein